MPSELPTPGATCTLTTPTVPLVWAFARGPEGDALVQGHDVPELRVVEQGVEDGVSVVPGLPKMYSTPWAIRPSMKTCLPRMSLEPLLGRYS